jgi:hypothetical protein
MVLKTCFLPQDYNIFSMWITKVEDQWGSYKSSVIFNSNKMSTQAIVCAMIFLISALQHVKGLQRGSKQIILSFSLRILCKQLGRLVELGARSSAVPSSWSSEPQAWSCARAPSSWSSELRAPQLQARGARSSELLCCSQLVELEPVTLQV